MTDEVENSGADESEVLMERIRDGVQQIAELVTIATTNAAAVQEKARLADESATTIQEVLSAANEGKANVLANKELSATYTSEAEGSREATAAILTEIETWKTQVAELLKDAKENSDKLQKLSAVADQKDVRVKRYEEQLAQFDKEHQALKTQIEGLLPGATSAGLAESEPVNQIV